MPFDAMTMAAVADELQDVAGSQIQRVIQPGAVSVALSIYGSGRQQWLVLSADPRFARVSLASERLYKAFPTPSAFVMLLRKHLEGVRIAGVSQPLYERVLFVDAGPEDHFVRLVSEVMGKHSNVMLLDAEDRILGALKIVPPRLSRVRSILPGSLYVSPPARGRDERIYSAGSRPNPVTEPGEVVGLLATADAATPVGDALLGLLPGSSPFLARQIALRAGIAGGQSLRDADLPELVEAVGELYSLFSSRDWHPIVFSRETGKSGASKSGDFAAFVAVGASDVQPVDSMSRAIEIAWADGESRDGLDVSRRALSQKVHSAIRGVEGRLASLHEGLAAAASAEEVKQRGQLMLAYQHMIEPRSPELQIPELGMTIPLNPDLSPQKNAERAFRRYTKLRDATRRIPGLLRDAERELDRLRDLATFVELADSEGSLIDLERQVHPEREDAARSSRVRTPSTRSRRRRGPLRFSLNGAVALVGRSAGENDELTFHVAGRSDLWLHARGRTGAHVILRPESTNPTEDELRSAAALAAYYSEGRSDIHVDVIVARVRDVRKIPGGAPGRVTYRNETTVTVPPSVGEWHQDLR